MKIKTFFLYVWYFITFPYYWIATRGVDKKLRKIAEEDRKNLINKNNHD